MSTHDAPPPRAGPVAELEQQRHDFVRQHRRHELRLAWELYRAANLREHATLVDLGCGDGAFLFELRRHWHHRGILIGVDCDSEALAGITHAARAVNLALLHADASCLPCPDESFDGVIVRHDLRGEQGIFGIANEIRRVVRPAGRAVLVAPSRVNFRLCREFLRRLVIEDPAFSLAPKPIGLRVEDAAQILSRVFGPHESRLYTDALYIHSLAGFLELFDTFRADLQPFPDLAQWATARAKAARWASVWLETRRVIAEPVTLGIFVATVL